jgi:multidrug efflux pump subunit AcrA (membrane-fusion protein)
VAGLTYAALAQVAVTVEAPARLVPEAGVLPLAAPAAITVDKLLVRVDDRVEKGQLLIVSQEDLSDEEEARIVADAKAVRAALDEDARFDCKGCVDALQRLAARAFVVESGGAIREPLANLRQRLQELVTVRTLFGSRGASTEALRRQMQVANEKLAEIRRRNAEAMLASRVEQLEAELAQARSQLAASERGSRADVEQARNRLALELEALETDLQRYARQQNIVAPIAGTITELAVQGPGQQLVPGQRLMEIVPADTALAGVLSVANKDVSRIRVGMTVRLDLAALPQREFGVALGEVVSVAPKASFDPRSGSKEPTYEVQVKLTSQGFERDGQHYPFRFGMSARGLVVAGYKSMLRLAIERLLNLKDEALQEA